MNYQSNRTGCPCGTDNRYTTCPYGRTPWGTRETGSCGRRPWNTRSGCAASSDARSSYPCTANTTWRNRGEACSCGTARAGACPYGNSSRFGTCSRENTARSICNSGITREARNACGCNETREARNVCGCNETREARNTCGCNETRETRNTCGCNETREARNTCGCNETRRDGDCDDDCNHGAENTGILDGKSLAMVYSPYQNFESLYDPRQGLCNGTIFGGLNKPFYGDRRGC